MCKKFDAEENFWILKKVFKFWFGGNLRIKNKFAGQKKCKIPGVRSASEERYFRTYK